MKGYRHDQLHRQPAHHGQQVCHAMSVVGDKTISVSFLEPFEATVQPYNAIDVHAKRGKEDSKDVPESYFYGALNRILRQVFINECDYDAIVLANQDAGVQHKKVNERHYAYKKGDQDYKSAALAFLAAPFTLAAYALFLIDFAKAEVWVL